MAGEEALDLQGLMGMLSMGGKACEAQSPAGYAAESHPHQPTRRKGGRERSEEYRGKGNELYKLGAFEGAVDYYTRAINADPRNEKAYGNRCAANTALKRFAEALNDADYGISINPEWAKLHSRKAVAHFYRKEYDESVVSYERALGLDARNAEYARGLEQARKLGGSAEALRRRKEAQRRVGTAAKARTPPHDSRVERDRRDLERYERELAGYHKQRRECAERWRASCGIAGGKDWPQEDRGRSVHVDIFGNLRGKCAESGCDGWHRDVDAVANAWGNMEALRCSKCGRENTEHEDCGQYPLNEPIKPACSGGARQELDIQGIHKAF
ncbi:HSP70-HSP90 organizing protein [Chloropicon roscoffensis]|uniref:HSP70-HSP90 organizing protein n=1 Tax=Chloropicon roscoffensis TaxID=1461544 RepID=A0AAX4P5Y4_9CHLO